MPLIGWRACRGLNVSDDALMKEMQAVVALHWLRACEAEISAG
jgi:hypothetical protein